jgi:iron complex outermembrane receptor protein
VGASTSQHYEVGAKWMPTRATRMDFNLYQIEASNEIVVALNTGGKSAYKNAPGTMRTGVEFSLSNLHTKQVSSLVSLSAIDANYTQAFCSSTTANCSAANNVLKGNKLAGIPQHYLFTELTWTEREQTSPKAVSRLGLRTGVELISAGRLFANDANTESADGYTVLNLKASHGWGMGKGLLTAYARVDNVTNEKYIGSVIVNTISTSKYYEPAPGVNYTVGLSLMVPL